MFISCCNDHIVGFSVGDKNFFTSFSDLIISYPTQIEAKFNGSLLLHKRAEEKYLAERKNRVKNLYCEICNMNINSSEEYIKHIKNKDHLELLNCLLEECFIQDKDN
jgi:hypothetical protein